MKTYPSLLAAVALSSSGCQSAPQIAKHAVASDITVNFSDPNKFTDVRESFGGGTSQYYLDMLSQHLKEAAALRQKATEKLTVTFTHIDLAGEFRPDQTRLQDVRIIKAIYAPHLELDFKWENASGAVIREGKRLLSDLNYDQDISIIGRDQPLYYDKQLLDHWLDREFSAKRTLR